MYVETYVDTTVAAYVDTPAETPADAPDDYDTNAPVDTGVVDEGGADHDARFAATDTVADADSDSGVASFFDAEADTDTDTDTSDEGGAPAQSVTDFFGGPDTTHEVAAEVGPATREVDMTALFDADAPEAEAYVPPGSYQTPASDSPFASELGGEHEAAVELPNTDTGFDMLRPDALDSEVLDDDAFFATLREAVHDDSPLGPREEGAEENDFYGDEGEKASFRDVFRRRR